MRTICASINRGLVFGLALMAALASPAEVTLRQSFKLSYGWNAFYIEVSPTQPLDEVFADWPVENVGFYDPASFLATRQFGNGFDSKGLSMQPVAAWVRNVPIASDAKRIPAGTVAFAFSTNVTKTTVSLTGVPAAPRMTWHVTNTNEVFHFVGFSLQEGASINPANYMKGFDGGILMGSFYKIAGKTAGQSPSFTETYSSDEVSDGNVRLVASGEQSDWSGALFVSPMNGIDFGTEMTRATLSVRNDGDDERTVAIDLLGPGNVGMPGPWGDFDLPQSALFLRDADVAHTNAAWNPLPAGTTTIATKRLGAEETWRLEFGLNRSALPAATKGATFGALLRITDVDGGSRMRADVPLVGAASGLDAANTAWPAGLWVAEVAFDEILPPGAKNPTETGGSAKIRLPVHIDGNGNVRLLQRVVAAGTTDADGTLTYHLYAGTAQVPNTASVAMRISAVTLPTETPVIEAEPGGSISGDGITFPFTVAANGATSLLRHPLHPQHDGLKWDFSTPAPSGDDFSNYKSDVKPETFSVSCRIKLSLNLDGGEAAWNPENTKSGFCHWTFSNLMRQGDITISGPMVIKRVSPIAEIILAQ